jgi:hypothetical protein
VDRRIFLTFGLSVLAAPLAAEAHAGKTPKIGYLSTTAGGEPIDIRFMQTLRDLVGSKDRMSRSNPAI